MVHQHYSIFKQDESVTETAIFFQSLSLVDVSILLYSFTSICDEQGARSCSNTLTTITLSDMYIAGICIQ